MRDGKEKDRRRKKKGNKIRDTDRGTFNAETSRAQKRLMILKKIDSTRKGAGAQKTEKKGRESKTSGRGRTALIRNSIDH